MGIFYLRDKLKGVSHYKKPLTLDNKIEIIRLVRTFYPKRLFEGSSKLYIMAYGEVIMEEDIYTPLRNIEPFKNLKSLVHHIESKSIDALVVVDNQDEHNEMLNMVSKNHKWAFGIETRGDDTYWVFNYSI